MRELTIQGANGTNTAEDVANIEKELSELGAEVKRISNTTSFNGKNVLDGKTATVDIQAGANKGEKLTINLTDVSTIAASVKDLKVADLATANKATSTLDAQLKAINTGRATLGAQQNRLEYTQNNLTTSSENLTAAESRIRDVDVAKEMVTLSKLNILGQAAQAMVAQANQQPQGVLQLLR